MQLQLEDLLYQNKAIQSAVQLFKGQSRNVSERTLLSQSNTIDITPNQCLLSPEQLHKNKLAILQQNALAENEAALSEEPQICIEMETGTGTTAQAVLELNKEDNGNRQFILVQLPEQIKADSAGFKKISDITIERVKRVVNGYGDNPQPLDAGFKVYQLTKSHFPRVDFKPDPEASEAENLQRLEDYITEKEAQLIGLFEPHEIRDEVLLKNGFRLNYQLQEQPRFTANTVSLVDDGEKSALICLDNTLSNKTVDQLLANPQAFICLERALNTDAKWNLRQHLKHLFVAF